MPLWRDGSVPGLSPILATDLFSPFEKLFDSFDKLIDALTSVPRIIYNFFAYFTDVPGDQLVPSLLVGVAAGGLLTALVYLVARGHLTLPSFSSRATGTGGLAMMFTYSEFGPLTAAVIGAAVFVAFVYLYEPHLLGLLSNKSRAELLAKDEPAFFAWSTVRAAIPAVVLGILAFYTTGLGAAIGIGLLVMLLMAYLYGENLRRFLSLKTVTHLLNRDAAISLMTGAAVGGVIGGLSSQILMYPTEHCTYLTDATQFEYRMGIVLSVISATFLLFPVWRWILRRSGKVTPSTSITSGNFRGFFVPYFLLVPTLLILVFFLYYPAIQVIEMSLTRTFLGRGSNFSCLWNYEKLSGDQFYESSFVTSFQITLAVIIIGMGLSLAVAVLASQKVKGAGIYRTWLIWPYAVSPVVAGVIFQVMFHPQVGPVNWVLHELFGIRPQWFREVYLAPWVVIIAAVWNSLGFNVLLYVAGLQNIPADLLEAASIDGANRFQRFVRITFPLLSPFTFFLLVTNVTYSFFGIFGAIDTLTQGGPWRQGEGATNVLIYNLYQDAFERQYKIGLAASQSLILFMLVAGLTILQFRYVERRVTYGG
jgi:sn-glycerol 3-phosphate transport system permease protein